MDMRRALNKRTIIVIVVILAVLLVAGGILVWRAASDTPESIVDPNAKSDELQDITYDTASTYKDSGSYAKGTIAVSGVALDGTSFESLEIADGVGEGEVYLDNVSVTEELLVRGGGENSVYLDIASDGTKKTLDKTNPGCSIPTVRVEKQNTHLVLGSQNIGELIMYSTNHVEIYGPVCSAKGSRVYQRDFRGGGSFRGGDCASGADRYLRRGRYGWHGNRRDGRSGCDSVSAAGNGGCPGGDR